MGKSIIITIDGPAGAGKSTVGLRLAQILGYRYVDSGALYRAVAWQAQTQGLDPGDREALCRLIAEFQPQITLNDQGFHLIVAGREITRELRTPEVSRGASRVAATPEVRTWVTRILRSLAAEADLVAEGRDLGSVVFPEAQVKLYLDADLAIRASRRQKEWQRDGGAMSLSGAISELATRDRQDQNRTLAPLTVPHGAYIVDTTHLTPDEVVEACLSRIREVLEGGLIGRENFINRQGGHVFMELHNNFKTANNLASQETGQEEAAAGSPEDQPGEMAATSSAQPSPEPQESLDPGAEAALEGSLSEESEAQQMEELYEESLRRVQEGEVVKGRIVSITKDYVMVDIGYKSEGQIPIAEFTTPEGEITAEVGDQVEALLESREDEEGPLMLSKVKASRIKVWEEISYAYHNQGVVEGTIVAKVKGGLSVDLGGVLAFLPGSQVDLVPVRHTDHLIGQRLTFHVLKFNRKRRNVVLSRRSLLEKLKEEAKATLLATLEEGKVVEGVIKNITDYGVFVDLGGLDGLLHITDLSYGRIRHPADLFKVGDTITVKVLSFDREKERISLGLKQLYPDPWTTVAEKYPAGSRITGKVVSLTDYGAFVELEPGVEGLIHISEMSWTRKIRHPNQVLSVGDTVEVVVLEVEPQRKRISLSLKQVEPNPWEVIGEKYPVGSIIEGKIKNITDFGIFIGIDEGIDGLVHISDISWTKRFKHPSELYKKGATVQAKVLYIDKENERFSLSIKELTPNPWETIEERYPINSVITGRITNITDFGFFVELEEGIEGLVHISELSRDKQKMAALKVGDTIRAKVIHASPQERRIGLSIRRLEAEEEQKNYRNYLKTTQEATSNLGEILRETLERERSDEHSSK
uniref:Cytidylate kinase n=1 Tax=Desulfobacca acetoxidans TaxID=60893 RepID=A0A7C5ALZ7_9BACT